MRPLVELDRIELTGIRAVGTIGVLPEEQARAQPFEVDVVIELDARAAGDTDELGDSLDYGVPIALVATVIEQERHQLLERVATRIAQEVLALPGADAVEVVVRKLRPPVAHDIASTGVRIRRRRAERAQPRRAPTVAYVALGSNLGDRRGYLRGAVLGLDGVRRLSRVYETEPIGVPDGGDAFLNMVVEVETRLDPYALLDECRRLEVAAGRERTVRWGSRTLDADVLLYGDVRIDGEELTIPHPRMWERRFVLAPLSDLAPERLPDGWEGRLPDGDVAVVDGLDLPGLGHTGAGA